jgi:uncharacterized Zn-binding protein involved in type VI secretion
MAIGYFIHEGDKTTCGGVVQEGERHFTLNGVPRDRDGDRVTCGKNGKTYVIAGGVASFTLNGRISAGSLDSLSTCPCRAELIPSHHSFSYEKTTSAPLSANRAFGQPGIQPDNSLSSATRMSSAAGYATAPSAPSPTGAVCDERFQLLNHQRLPFGSLNYALLQNDQCIAYGKLDDRGHSSAHGSTSPASLKIATGAPSPVME